MTVDDALTLVSGGQTGVDQGGLSAALDCGTPCGGWCPARRASEDGEIPTIYPVRELPGAGYAERTLRNVQDSDGTAIIFDAVLEGGTRLTRTCCEQWSKPCVLIDASAMNRDEALAAVVRFVGGNDIRILNVAGPRASKWPGAHDYTHALMTAVLVRLGAS